MTEIYDVVVIGAGPIGSYTAFRLAGMGYQVGVLERRQKPGGKNVCTGIVGHECISNFPVDKGAILRGVNSARIFSPSGKCLRLSREEPQAYVLDRTAFDRDLARQAQSKGAEYWLETRAEDIEVKEDKVEIRTVYQQVGKVFKAKAVVIAAGFGTGLTEKIGKFADFVAGAQADVATSIDEVEVYSGKEVAPGFFAWLVPTSSGKGRAGLLSRRNPSLLLKKLMESLAAEGKIESCRAEISLGGIPLKPLTRTYGERTIVVGDAAGQVKPTTGGGIYYGLLCADIAAGTLHQALQRNDLSAKSLTRYEREWKKRLGQELKIGYWARKLFERLSDRQIDRIFDTVKASGIDEALLKDKDLTFDWHSKAILALLKEQAITKTMNLIRVPARVGKIDPEHN